LRGFTLCVWSNLRAFACLPGRAFGGIFGF
jgi:hypothetical protein